MYLGVLGKAGHYRSVVGTAVGQHAHAYLMTIEQSMRHYLLRLPIS